MRKPYRWDPCVEHRAEEAKKFFSQYYNEKNRKVLLIAGAGFDPRSTAFADLIAPSAANFRAFLIREERPTAPSTLVVRADQNAAKLSTIFQAHRIVSLSIFTSDNAVVGGTNAIKALAEESLSEFTDVVVDMSALSIGTSFPIVRYLVEQIVLGVAPRNLHIVVAHDPNLDDAVKAITSDIPDFIRGFRGGYGLDATATAAKLWLPQLSKGRRAVLSKLFDLIRPHDTCPVLPFPSGSPRLGDELVEEYLTEIESAWSVDARNIVYAAEDDPLDLYRTVLQLDDLRQRVFQESGGSLLVLSPSGKIMALGALMAALERDLPVAYVEAIGYSLDESAPLTVLAPDFVHVWLEGDAYPSARSPLVNRGAYTHEPARN